MIDRLPDRMQRWQARRPISPSSWFLREELSGGRCRRRPPDWCRSTRPSWSRGRQRPTSNWTRRKIRPESEKLHLYFYLIPFWNVLQWKPLNVIILGQRDTYNMNQMIIITMYLSHRNNLIVRILGLD